MKITSENIKSYLKFSNHVLGVYNIYSVPVNALKSATEVEKKKIFNFYLWPDVKYIALEKLVFESQLEKSSLKTFFVFVTPDVQIENQLKNQSAMISKMNQALGGADKDLIVGWISTNAEIDFFAYVAEVQEPLRIVIFRESSVSKNTLFESGSHKILETLSPLVDVNDRERKQYVWNDFKRLLALSQ